MHGGRIEVAILTPVELAIAVVDEQLIDIEDARATAMLVPDQVGGDQSQKPVARYVELLDQRRRLEGLLRGDVHLLLESRPCGLQQDRSR